MIRYAWTLLLAVAALAQDAPKPQTPNEALDLSGTWQVTWTEGIHGQIWNLPNRTADRARCIDVPVPMELHQALIGKGLLDEPTYGANSLKARWVEEQVWQYSTAFDAPAAALEGSSWLVFEQLDLTATIVLNGQTVGTHKNAHYPARIDVTGKLKEGRNELIVVVESGLWDAADRNGGDYNAFPEAILTKRPWLRKPQYQFGWDWNPRLLNVGISGPVRLEWARTARLDQVVLLSRPSADFSTADLIVRAWVDGLRKEGAATVVLRARVEETGQEVEQQVGAAPGLVGHELRLTIDKPRLWWPVGHGEQALYNVEVSLEADGKRLASTRARTGIRKVEIDRPAHPEGGEYFTLKVNGRPIFCKGGNWVPADMITSRVTPERLTRLIDLAVQANFNLMRIWGGGEYAGHKLLDLCDERGLLVWHDMLFACSKYPGEDRGFLTNVRSEMTWAVRELARHPSLAVWCGNNENEWQYPWSNTFGKAFTDHAIYHGVIPAILRAEDPTRPYWPSSPYSPDTYANDPTRGDQHPWGVTLQNDGTNMWAYRTYVDRFPNEGGILGASTPATLRQFLPKDQQTMRSFCWEHHDNAANFWTGEAGVTYRYVQDWLGRPISEYSMDDYIFASALLQAEGLAEYANNYRSRMFSSSAAIFWMYNDSWPVTHGWTIVDYYLRKKLAFHPVRRAFLPVTVIVADRGDQIVVFGVNEGSAEWKGQVRYGLFGLGGGLPVDKTEEATLPANSSTRLAALPRAEWEKLGIEKHGAFALLLDAQGATAAQHRLLLTRFKDLAWAAPEIQIERAEGKVTLRSSVFAWGVALDLDGEAPLADNCFDLLPGIPYTIAWPDSLGAPQVRAVGNNLVRK